MARPPAFWPPAFWSAPGHPAGRALSPLGEAYARAAARRLRRAVPHRAGVPVLCVGNATLGGVGKTPFTILLARHLANEGRTPHILTRGYGGRARGPLRVADQSAAVVGDEALLLARHAPVWVGADRAETARAAEAAGADVLLMDDGFQNPGLFKDGAFLLIDAEALFGNGRVFPAGPLREPPAAAAARAQALVSVGRGDHAVPDAIRALASETPILRAWVEVETEALDRTRPVWALAGIGRPARFFDALTGAGFALAGRTAFADHHPFRETELRSVLAEAEACGAQPATTQKDIVRMPPALRNRFVAVPARMRTDEAALAGVLGTIGGLL